MTDLELLHRACREDAAAWRTLYGRYLPMVWRRAYALCGCTHAAEDITSEVMVALVRNLRRLEQDGTTVAGWLLSVVRRQAAEHHRRAFRARNKLALAAVTPVESAGRGPTARLEREETRLEVLRVLDALPERQRLVLEWKYVEALGVREIAERLGESERAVEAVLYRARRGFRKLFESRIVVRVSDEREPQTI
ncbi:MAG: RNA polymerase sigma factor [Pirellulales bacterium]